MSIRFVTDIIRDLFKKDLPMLYFATFVMRFSAYLTIALLSYMITNGVLYSAVIVFYSIAEVLTVSIFGVLTDRRGRRPILISAHLITTLGIALFAVLAYLQGNPSDSNILILIILVIPLLGILGTGAASEVASAMTMIADESTLETRAQYMGFFDLATLGGFAIGLATGHIMSLLLKVNIEIGLTIALISVILSLVLVYLWVGETISLTAERHMEKLKIQDFFTRILNVIKTNKDLQKVLPVYIPIISLYGLLIGSAKTLIENQLSPGITKELIVVVGILGLTIGSSILLLGKLSDRYLIRRPFIIGGLICLAIFLTLFEYYQTTNNAFGALYSIWPIVAVLGFGIGAFPPAVLAYLTDISKKDSRGTTFGVYSVIFGTGMIIGPLIGSAFAIIGQSLNIGQVWGIIIAVILLVLISCIGTLFLTERAVETKSIPVTTNIIAD